MSTRWTAMAARPCTLPADKDTHGQQTVSFTSERMSMLDSRHAADRRCVANSLHALNSAQHSEPIMLSSTVTLSNIECSGGRINTVPYHRLYGNVPTEYWHRLSCKVIRDSLAGPASDGGSVTRKNPSDSEEYGSLWPMIESAPTDGIVSVLS